jgi:signal transduction histidine kinase
MSSLYSEDSTRDKTVSSLALSATTVNFAWLADTRSKDVKIDSDFQLKKKTYFFRGLVMFGLLAICAICGTLIFFLLRMVEERLFESEYESIASQVITSSKTGLNKRSLGPRTMATRIGTLFDNEIYWPYVSVDGYYNIANRIKTLVHIKSLEFYPIVKHEEVSSFEDFAYDYFLSDPYVAPGAGITDIGKGIYAIDETTGSKYFDRSGNTTYGSPYKIIAPLLQSGEYKLDDGSLPPYMFNYHSAQNLGSALDHIINCVSNSSFDDSTILNDCGTISDLFEDDDNAISVITQPIFIANTTDLVGFVNSEISWKDILRDIVPDSVDGLDCIIRTEASVSSYQIQNGIALYKGARDIHDSNFNSYRKEGAMLNYELTTAATTTYLLQVYPRQAFVETYLSDTPLYAACGAVALIVLTSAIFFLYDYAIKSEVIAKQAVLDTKRKFVQFIAREVRTPLKTVGIGLGLLKLEINNLVELIMNNPNQILNVCGEQVNDWIQLAHDAIGNSESAIMGLDDLLNHEKMELGIIQFDYKAIDIWDLLRKTFNMFKIHASQKKIQYVLQIERWDEGIPRELKNAFDCLRVVGDINRLAQVLRILLSNALKYTPESGEVVFAGKSSFLVSLPSVISPFSPQLNTFPKG